MPRTRFAPDPEPTTHNPDSFARLVPAVLLTGAALLLSGCQTPPGGQPAAPAGATATQPAATAPATDAAPPGVRFRIATGGDVFVPDYLPRGLAAPDLLVHFHGTPAVVERELAAVKLPVVLVTVNYRGLSGVYERPFAEPDLFPTILAEALAGLRERGLAAPEAHWGRLYLSSFSAGFGAIRTLLAVPEHYTRAAGLVLADTLYAGYETEEGVKRLAERNMADFRRYAADAAAGQRVLVLTHSLQRSGRYAGTEETADDLIRHVGATRTPVDTAGPGGIRIVSRVDVGGFHVRGCAGSSKDDHAAHLYNLRLAFGLLAEGLATP